MRPANIQNVFETTLRFLFCSKITGIKVFFVYTDLKLKFRDATTNLRLAGQLGLRKRFQECLRDAETVNHGYVVINNSSKNQHDELRVSFNIFGEFRRFGPFPIFYVND